MRGICLLFWLNLQCFVLLSSKEADPNVKNGGDYSPPLLILLVLYLKMPSPFLFQKLVLDLQQTLLQFGVDITTLHGVFSLFALHLAQLVYSNA
jgi:hypothetical protein